MEGVIGNVAETVKNSEKDQPESSSTEKGEGEGSVMACASNDKTVEVAAAAGKGGAAGEEGVQVIENPPESLRKRSKSFEEALERRKRRRRLRRMLRQAGEFPSFVALISRDFDSKDAKETTTDQEDKEEYKEKTPDVVIINVDDYLGLTEGDTSSKAQGRSNSDTKKPDSASSTNKAIAAASTPADEGYYEGRVLLASPDDDQYLTTLQQLIRSNLEFFSATATDAAGSQSGRRYPIVQGKVGIRCIHCAKVALEHEAAMAAKVADNVPEPDRPGSTGNGNDDKNTRNDEDIDFDNKPKAIDPARIWPPGSISYPLNTQGLYSICSQKPQLHFESCPNMPPTLMAQIYRHMNENASKAGEVRVKSREVPASMYYTVSAKRIGLVNVPGGLRFGRDLSLEPLPIEVVLAQERQENDEKRVLVAPPILPDKPSSKTSEAAGGSSASRFTADPASAQVLAEALAEPDDQPNHLARAEDKSLITDYIFLIIRQMAVCRAVPADFATRGKKTKKMRIGFAGFCCRHCLKVLEEADGNELARAHGASGFSCRSYASEIDTLGSAISNSFADHLAKCSNTPKHVRKALAVYKRIHPGQMAELSYGSQRKKFEELWYRLRAADIDEQEMNRRIKEYKPGQPDLPAIINTEIKPPRPKEAPKPTPKKVASNPKTKTPGRDFPTSKVGETKRMLAMAENSWDWSENGENGGMIQPSDRDLVSDYVFLTCRNLKVAIPTAADIAKGRRGPATGTIIAGMCCMHCDGKDPSMIAPSARSFPTAPDNYASAFNSSLYNHMQKCQYISEDVKRALADLRKIHSSQIGHLQVGSQRRFFGNLCSRLKKVKLPGRLPPGPAKVASPATPRRASRTSSTNNSSRRGSRATTRGGGDDAILSQFRFFEAPLQSFFCLRCRMVPLQFRARGSLCFAKPSLDFMSEHHEACKEDGMDLWFCVESLKDVFKDKKLDVAALTHPLFKEVILQCFGGNQELTEIFTLDIVKVHQMSINGGVTRAVENCIKAKSQGMWTKLPRNVDSAKVMQAFEKFAATVKGASPVLTDHDALVKYLLLISPSLRLGDDEEDNHSEGEEEAEGNGEDGKDEDERKESAKEYSEENEKALEIDEGAEAVNSPARRRGGKELRKMKKADSEDEEKHGDDDDGEEIKVVQPQDQRRAKGKELRRKRPDEEEDDDDDDDDDDADDEVIEITPRKQSGKKELRRGRRNTNKPDYNEDNDEEDEDMEDELEDDDLEESEQVGSVREEEEEEASEQDSNGDFFEDEELIDVEDGGEHSDPDVLMREGIDDDLDGEVQMELEELDK